MTPHNRTNGTKATNRMNDEQKCTTEILTKFQVHLHAIGDHTHRYGAGAIDVNSLKKSDFLGGARAHFYEKINLSTRID